MKQRIEVGGVLREAFEIYREHAGTLLPVAFWLFLAVGAVEELAYAYVVTAVIGGMLGAAAMIVYQGMVAGLVRDAEERRHDSSAGGMLRSVGPVLLSLVVASLLAVAGTFLGFAFFVIPGFLVITFWAVIAPVIVVERTGPIKALGRSQDLVGGNAWRVFAVVSVGLLLVVALTVALVLLADLFAYGPLVRIVFTALVGAVSAPVGGLIAAVLYFRLREIERPASAVAEEPGHSLG